MGVLIFWLHYIIAGILLYLILRCMYIKENKPNDISYHKRYIKTDNDAKLKHPLWEIILFLFAFVIPVFNLIVLVIYLFNMTMDSSGSEYCRYYCKSFFNKEY